MRIAVNTRFLLKDKLEGFGRFTLETFKRITVNHPEHEFIFFFDRPFDEKYVFGKNITPVVLFPPARHPFLFICWFEMAVRRALKKYRADLFISPDGYLSLGSSVKQIAVIHDLNFEYHPEDLPKISRNYYLFFFPRFAHKATRIITVSEFSKNDIAQKYAISKDKIDVVYNGVGGNFKSLQTEEKQVVQQKFSEGNPYFIYVGALHPRKNIKRLLLAFDLFKKEHKAPFKLLLAGGKQWWSIEMEEAFKQMEFRNDVIFTGYVSDENLPKLLAGAEALTYISYFEGFGIPIIEGFKSGIPVLTSNVTALPEIAGGAALEIDPFSVESIKKGMMEIINSQVKTTLIEAGFKRAELFTWDNAANQIWKSIKKVLDEKEA